MILLAADYWEIKNTKNKGRGLFATKDIIVGTIIGDYIGVILHPKDVLVNEENFYLMYYHDYAVILPDLKKPGVHLLNHSCLPNCWIYIHKGHTLAFAMRPIIKGEELTIPYLLSPKGSSCNPCPHICNCGEAICSRTMHLSEKMYKLWRKFNESQAKETKKEQVSYGKKLLPLSSYPKIPESYIKQIKKSLLFR